LVAEVGLEVCLEEGLAAPFFVAVFVTVALLSGVFFALDAGVLEAGFFPVTSFLAAFRREAVVVFFVEVVLLADLEEDIEAFLAAGSALALVLVALAFVAVFAGLAATLGSFASFFTVVFVVSLDSLVVVFLLAGFLAAEGFVALVEVAVDLDLVGFAGAFLVAADLDTFVGLFSLVSVSLFLAVVFGGSLTRPERPFGR